MNYLKCIFAFLFFLQTSAFAQSSKLPSQRKCIVMSGENRSTFFPDNQLLKSASVNSIVLDSSYLFNWDSASDSWTASFKNIYTYNAQGDVISKHAYNIGIDGKTPYPYSLEERSYYPDGILKEQTNSYWDNLLNGFQAGTRYQYKFNIEGSVTDLYLFFPGGPNGWYCSNHYHQVFNKYNNLIEYYEYTANDPTDEPELTRKQFTTYNEFEKISSFIDSILDDRTEKFICNELEHYSYDELGIEIGYIMWQRLTFDYPLELVQKIETTHNSNEPAWTKTYYSRDTVSDTWIPTSRNSETYDPFHWRILESKGYVWDNFSRQWIPTYWNSTSYGEGNDYDVLVTRYWNNDLQQFENSIKYENTYNESNSLVEHSLYEWKSGWKYIETTSYNYDPDKSIQVNTLKSWNETDSALRNSRKWILYYSNKEFENHIYDTTILDIVPNPAINVVSVLNCPFGGTLEIYDIKGVRLLFDNNVTIYSSFDIGEFTPGIYIIKFTLDGKSRYRKFIKQNQSF